MGCEGCGSEADPAQGLATMAWEGAPQTQAITAWVEVGPQMTPFRQKDMRR